MISTTRVISPYVNFIGGGESFGIVDSQFTVTVSIPDDASKIVMSVRCDRIDVTPATAPGGPMKGYNVLFVSGLLTPRAATPFYDRIGNEQSGWGGSWQKALDVAASSSFGLTWAQAQGSFLVAAGIIGNSASDCKTSGMAAGQTRTLEKALSPSDFDSSGNYVGTPLFCVTSEWWNTEGLLTGMRDVDGELIYARDFVTTTDSYGFTFGDLDYYPGMTRDGQRWMSCNRADGGRAAIMKGGQWRDVKNTMNPTAASVNKGLVRHGSWMAQNLIGEGKDR